MITNVYVRLRRPTPCRAPSLYLPFQAVHAPLSAPASWTAKFKQSDFGGDANRWTYAAMVAQMDGANGYDDDEGSEEEEYEDEDDDDEPQTEEEWMEKLRRQQAELLRLRQAISQVREAGGESIS